MHVGAGNWAADSVVVTDCVGSNLDPFQTLGSKNKGQLCNHCWDSICTGSSDLVALTDQVIAVVFLFMSPHSSAYVSVT